MRLPFDVLAGNIQWTGKIELYKKWKPKKDFLKNPVNAARLCFITRRSGRAETCGRLLSSTANGGLTAANRPGILFMICG